MSGLSFGAALKAARDHRNLTIVQVANQCGVKVATVSDWERDAATPKGEEAPRLFAMFPRLKHLGTWRSKPQAAPAAPPADLSIVTPQPQEQHQAMADTPPRDDTTEALVRLHDQMERLNGNLERLADLDARLDALRATAAPTSPAMELELHRLNRTLSRLAERLEPAPVVPVPPPAAPSWTDQAAAFFLTSEAEEMARQHKLTGLVVAQRAGLKMEPGVAVPQGQLAYIGKIATDAGYVPVRMGNAPIYYVRAEAAQP